MLTLTIIIGLVALGLLIFAGYRAATEAEGIIPGTIGFVLGIAWFGMFLSLARWQPSDATLTGYIYQRTATFGYVSYDLRFSQNAGSDNQPSFCVKASSKEDERISKLVGTDTKATVYVPTHSFFLGDNPWACSSYAQLREASTKPASQ